MPVALLVSLAVLVLLGAKCSLFNKAPSVPVVTGPTAGVAGVPVTFTATATDPDGDSVAFQFDWGDSSTLEWSSFIASGETSSISHTYSDSGSFTVKAKAKDAGGKQSGWSGERGLNLVAAGPGYVDTVVGNLTLPWSVLASCMSRDGALLGLGGMDDHDSVAVVRTSGRTLAYRLGLGHWAGAVAFSPDDRYVYASGVVNDTAVVLKVDIAQARVVASVHVGEFAYELAVTPDGDRALVGDGHRVLLLDADSLKVLDTVDMTYSVRWLTLNQAGTALYVSTNHGIGIVDMPSCSLRVFSQAVDPAWVQALSYDEQLLYASSEADSGLTVLRASDLGVVGHMNIHQDGVMDIAPSPDGYYLYLSYVGLHVLDLRSMSLVDSIAFTRHGRIYVHPSGDSLYYAEGATVHVIGKR